MSDPMKVEYNKDIVVESLEEYNTVSLLYILCEHVALKYFGNLTSKSVVEFGCGSGMFLKKCLEKGAASCLGFDLSQNMIDSGMAGVTKPNLRLVIGNCFQPIENNTYGHFDFATCNFFIHECANEELLQIYLRNVFNFLKPGGKFFVFQDPSVPITTTSKDEEIIANLWGYKQLLKSGPGCDEPFRAKCILYYPSPRTVSKSGRPFSREPKFTVFDYCWSKEKLIENFQKAGFIKIELLPQTFPDDVPLSEVEDMNSLEESPIMIGMEKPRT